MKNLIFLILLFLFIGCAENGTSEAVEDSTPAGNMPSELYGEWLYINSQDSLTIDSTTYVESFVKESSDVIRISESGQETYLLRASVAYTKATGRVYGDATTVVSSSLVGNNSPRFSLSGVGGIKVVLNNVLDSNIKSDFDSNESGHFENHSLPSGTYEISAEHEGNSFRTEVKLDGNEKDLGNFVLKDINDYNFKTELVFDEDYIFADGTIYYGAIRVKNIGGKLGVGLTYEFSVDDPLVDIDFSIDIGSIETSSYKDMDLSFSLDGIPDSTRSFKILTKIKDVYGNEWNDEFPVKVYRRSMTISLSSDRAAVNGFVILPGKKVVSFQGSRYTGHETSVTVPVDVNEQYYVMLANPDIENETSYSIGIDTDSAVLSDIQNFIETIAYEPNNDKINAPILELNTTIISYLHLGDLDFYRIDMTADIVHSANSFFEPKVNMDLNSSYTEDIQMITFLEVDDSATVSLSNGELYLNGVLTSESSIIVDSDDNISIKIQNANTLLTTTESNLTINDIVFPISIQTRDYHDGSYFVSKLNSNVGDTIFSNTLDMSSFLNGTETTNVMFDGVGKWYVNDIEKVNSSAILDANDSIKLSGLAPQFEAAAVSITITVFDRNRTFEIASNGDSFENVDGFTMNEELISNSISMSQYIGSGSTDIVLTGTGSIYVNDVKQGSSTVTVSSTDTIKVSADTPSTHGLIETVTLSILGKSHSYRISTWTGLLDAGTDIVHQMNGLQWMKSSDYYQWKKSDGTLEAFNYCSDLSYGGYSDWDLPTTTQYDTILSRYFVGVYPSQFSAFSTPPSGDYWTSNYYDSDSEAIYVNFSQGYRETIPYPSSAYYYFKKVMCVRGAIN